jgi:predicted enzyme related to lactoylglutathione lyase
VTDIETATQHLSAAGTRLLGPILRETWGDLTVFEDPDGNVLKLMQPNVSR